MVGFLAPGGGENAPMYAAPNGNPAAAYRACGVGDYRVEDKNGDACEVSPDDSDTAGR